MLKARHWFLSSCDISPFSIQTVCIKAKRTLTYDAPYYLVCKLSLWWLQNYKRVTEKTRSIHVLQDNIDNCKQSLLLQWIIKSKMCTAFCSWISTWMASIFTNPAFKCRYCHVELSEQMPLSCNQFLFFCASIKYRFILWEEKVTVYLNHILSMETCYDCNAHIECLLWFSVAVSFIGSKKVANRTVFTNDRANLDSYQSS